MATTTVQLKLDSAAGSLTTSIIAIDDTMTLYNAGTTTGMSKTTGLARQTFAASTETKLLEADDYTDNKASKLYIKNTDLSGGSASNVRITLGTISGTTIGLLHNDEWALFPWSAASDINVTCSSASTIVEWMLIFE
jgi:hypothetical protein